MRLKVIFIRRLYLTVIASKKQIVRWISGALMYMSSVGLDAKEIAPDVYVFPPMPNPMPEHMQYFPRLLNLALEKTKSQGPYAVRFFDGPATPTRRLVRAVKKQQSINIFWTMTTAKLEAEFRLIDVPLLKGTNGYRVFLIRKEDQILFNLIDSLDDLRGLKAGQVEDWPDTKIMEQNDLNVITSTTYRNLIPMLIRGRFDFFPRGIYEAYGEAKLYEDLVVEKSLALSYHAPIYFFMNKENDALASRIKQGLDVALRDGSFDALFQSVSGFSNALEIMKNSNRKIIHLVNDKH